MVNTVGSYENIHWQKKWKEIKRSAVLNLEQRSLIIGSLLGDGTMRIGKGAVNANFKVEHGLEQKDYVLWKYRVLEPLVMTEPKISYRYTADRQKYQKSWWFRTFRHPILTDIYKFFYIGSGYRTGRKIIPSNIQDYLDPLALAVWIMDDGSYNKDKIDISTYSFLFEEIELLCRSLEKRYGLSAWYYKDRDKGYRMYFRKSVTGKLVDLIRPHIVTSMMYKIGFRNPVTTDPKGKIRPKDRTNNTPTLVIKQQAMEFPNS